MAYDLAFWIKVIEFILWILKQGGSTVGAVSAASCIFGISADEIWNHGGF